MEISEKIAIKIRLFHENDLEDVLKLIERSDSTNRSSDTWLGNDMTAILAFDGNELIGAIPFEKREIVVKKDVTFQCLWASGVHVDPEYRSRGIGSQMDEKISVFFASDFKSILVCREDETSPAYRWYQKLNYQLQTGIISLKKQVDKVIESNFQFYTSKQEIQDIGDPLLVCFNRNIEGYGGFPKRYEGFWSDKINTHYYKNFYDYSVVCVGDNHCIDAYAFLGKTDLKDKTKRFDILEISAPQDEGIRMNLINAIDALAKKEGLKEMRVQVAKEDEHLLWLQSIGFHERWRTNILAKQICNQQEILNIQWRFFQLDYI